MGQEFTNALQQTPLWQFALKAYPANKTELLVWQDNHGAHVNDLMAIAYCVSQDRALTPYWLQQEQLVGVRALTIRIREQRRMLASQSSYNVAKEFELNLEGLEIMLLQSMIREYGRLDLMNLYEKQLALKKGALAPLIENLIVAVN